MNMLLKASLLLIGAMMFGSCPTKALKFALCPKSINAFYDLSYNGCIDRARELSLSSPDYDVECVMVGPNASTPDGAEQAELVMSLIEQGIDGLSIGVTNEDTIIPVINEALARNIPVVTFDSDAPNSARTTYIGTDNDFFGRQLGKLLQQVRPQGGTYAILADNTPNLIARANGVRASIAEDGHVWKEAALSPLNMKENFTLAIELIRELCLEMGDELHAVIPVSGGPMFLEDLWIELVQDFPNVIFVVADGIGVQLEMLSQNKASGLIAQLPYDMGAISMDTLLTLAMANNKNNFVDTATSNQAAVEAASLPDFLGTNVLEHMRIPLTLPELKVDQNYLTTIRILGFTFYGIVFLVSLGFGCWTWMNRNVRVVKVAQPGFLCMIAVGVVIFGAAMIPLGFDDSSSSFTQRRGQFMCMSPVWLVFTGFTITFSALFAKMWRINRINHNAESFLKVKVTALDVLKPFIILLTLNFITLTTWTFVDPLRYERRAMEGTDPWNRVLATYGTCVMDRPWPYVSITVVLNFGILVVANVQAYQARNFKSEFSESKYVAMVVVCMLQAFLIGGPLLVLVKELPQAWYLTLTFIIFIISMMVLLLIFIPKITLAHQYSNPNGRKSEKMLNSLRKSDAVSGRSGPLDISDSSRFSYSGRDRPGQNFPLGGIRENSAEKLTYPGSWQLRSSEERTSSHCYEENRDSVPFQQQTIEEMQENGQTEETKSGESNSEGSDKPNMKRFPSTTMIGLCEETSVPAGSDK